MRVHTTLQLCALAVFMRCTDACWYQSKRPALRRVESYMMKNHKDPRNGLSKADLDGVVANLPAAAKWVVGRIHGVAGVMSDCDTNNDGVVHLQEALDARRCADSCWKQIALTTFLN